MPAVSRERVSSLLNFIVQLASHIWVLESLGGFGGREGWLLQPLWSWKLPPHPGPVSGVGWGAPGQRRVAEEGVPPPAGEHPSDSGLREERQEVGGRGPSVGILLLKHKNKSSRPAHTGVL